MDNRNIWLTIIFIVGLGIGGVSGFIITQEIMNDSGDMRYNDASDQDGNKDVSLESTDDDPKDSEPEKKDDIPSQDEMYDILEMDKAREDGEMFYSQNLGIAFSYGVQEFNRGYSTIEVVEDGNGLNVVSLTKDKDIDEIGRFSGHRLEVFDKPKDQSVKNFLSQKFLSEEYPDCFIRTQKNPENGLSFFPRRIHKGKQESYFIETNKKDLYAMSQEQFQKICPKQTQAYLNAGWFMSPVDFPERVIYLRIAAGTGIAPTADDGMPGEENGEWFDTLHVF